MPLDVEEREPGLDGDPQLERVLVVSWRAYLLESHVSGCSGGIEQKHHISPDLLVDTFAYWIQ